MLTPGYSVPDAPAGARRRKEYEMVALRDEARRWLRWDRVEPVVVDGCEVAPDDRASALDEVLLPVLVVALHVRRG